MKKLASTITVSNNSFLLTCLFSFLFSVHSTSFALPIGFGVTQGDLEYHQLKSKNFYVYHDDRAPNEAKGVINSLEAAKPILEKWMGVKRDAPLPVIMSAVTSNASFANFITDAIELQTLGQGDRDLYWHELIHIMMYQHYHNIFGPPGAIIHLPFMPAWFLEGLAESMAVSVQSDVMASIERYQALSGRWFTYDRLHSLYRNPKIALPGYAISGAFVSWIFEKAPQNSVADILTDFRDYSQPWYWVWAAVPFNGFMPMDASLESKAKKGGEELYDLYKQEMSQFWKKNQPGPFLAGSKKPRLIYQSSRTLDATSEKPFLLLANEEKTFRSFMTFNPDTGWLDRSPKPLSPKDMIPDQADLITTAFHKNKVYFFKRNSNDNDKKIKLSEKYILWEGTYNSNKKRYLNFKKIGFSPSPSKIFVQGSKIFIVFSTIDSSGICTFDLGGKSQKPTCSQVKSPRYRKFLGHEWDALGNITATYLATSEQTLVGDRHQIEKIEVVNGQIIQTVPFKKLASKPVNFAKLGSLKWFLFAERSFRTLRGYDASGACIKQLTFSDLIPNMRASGKESVVLGIYEGNRYSFKEINPNTHPSTGKCKISTGHSSPLIESIQSGNKITLKDAIARSSFRELPKESKIKIAQTSISEVQGIDKSNPKNPKEKIDLPKSKPYEWHPRPVLLFPWIGAEDALGSQYGLVSIPLMDHLQNETVRLTALYGPDSRYPATDLTLQTTRFKGLYELSLFRAQVWNGAWRLSREAKTRTTFYYDEVGLKAQGSRVYGDSKHRKTLTYGMRLVELKPYIGPTFVRKGDLYEPYASLGLLWRSGKNSYSMGFSGRAAPPGVNSNFEYNQLGYSMSWSRGLSLWNSTSILGFKTSRTRGTKMRLLKEVYTPLKTFVPGSGGGYNKNNFSLAGVGSLFSPRYGDSQLRLNYDWTFPLINDFDKLLWIFYISRLDFTFFLNHGGAWYGDSLDTSGFVTAHGYNLDLQFDNKGVNFNIGLGSGQVLNDNWQFYLTSGFDALF